MGRVVNQESQVEGLERSDANEHQGGGAETNKQKCQKTYG